jgi:hypothetical protein
VIPRIQPTASGSCESGFDIRGCGQLGAARIVRLREFAITGARPRIAAESFFAQFFQVAVRVVPAAILAVNYWRMIWSRKSVR